MLKTNVEEIDQTEVAYNVRRIEDRISDLALQCGRRPDDVRIIGVSKNKSWQSVDAAVRAGLRNFGENTLQDAMMKIPRFPDRPVEWHFIGHLQSNKAKAVPGCFAWVHSVDSLHLVVKLSQAAEKVQQLVNILIQVNMTADVNKYGVSPDRVFELVEALREAGLPGLRLRGLMTIGRHDAKEAEARTVFARLRRLRDACVERFRLSGFTELSMGMSSDYAPAILEGATMVRIGTAVFGERIYPAQ